MFDTQTFYWQIVSSRTLTKPLVLKNGKPAGRGSITVSQLRNKCLQGSSLIVSGFYFLVSGLNAVSLFYRAIKRIFVLHQSLFVIQQQATFCVISPIACIIRASNGLLFGAYLYQCHHLWEIDGMESQCQIKLFLYSPLLPTHHQSPPPLFFNTSFVRKHWAF